MNKKLSVWTKIGLTILVLSACTATIWWLPKQQADFISNPVERAKVEISARDTLVKAIGGILVFVTAFVSLENLKATQKNILVAEEKQITERFSKAIEMLGNEESAYIRIGGIYALERIANDSDKDYWTVIQVLAAFVRSKTTQNSHEEIDVGSRKPFSYEEYSWRKECHEAQELERNGPEPDYDDDGDYDYRKGISTKDYRPQPAPIDIQTAISVIGRRSNKGSPTRVVDFSHTIMEGVTFEGCYDHVNFYRAHFKGVTFQGCTPKSESDTTFHKANFNEAFFEKVIIDNTCFNDAYFAKSVFLASTFESTSFKNTDFSEAEFSGNTQIEDCHFDNSRLVGMRIGSDVPRVPKFQRPKLFPSTAYFEERSEIKRTSFTRANLTQTYLSNSRFKECVFKATDFEHANMTKVIFSNSDISNAIFDRSYLGKEPDECTAESFFHYEQGKKVPTTVVFENTNLSQITMNEANITNANFESVNNIDVRQLKTAHGWEKAKYSPEVAKSLGL